MQRLLAIFRNMQATALWQVCVQSSMQLSQHQDIGRTVVGVALNLAASILQCNFKGFSFQSAIGDVLFCIDSSHS